MLLTITESGVCMSSNPIQAGIEKLQVKLTRWKDKDYDKKYEAIVCRLLRETAGLIEGEMAARTQVSMKLGPIEECFRPEWWAQKGGE